jgi:uncharacterized protein (TIGR02271 family)
MAAEQNTQTIIATFEDYGAATNAKRDLENSGVASDSIQIDSDRKTTGAGSGGYQKQERQESGFTGWWNSLFGSGRNDDERSSYEGALERGDAILRVTLPASSVDRAVEILNSEGAVDVDRRSGKSAASAPDTAGNRAAGAIEVMEEELAVGKRAVRRGGVRIYSHTVSQPVEEQVKLREERVNVERRQVNREVRPGEDTAWRDQTIEVEEIAEEPVISKRARVREEVVVGKEVTERSETVRDNVRHTEVEVEQLDDERQKSGTGPRTTESAGVGSHRPRTGMSPNSPASSVMSGGGTTAGAGTLAGGSTTGDNRDLNSGYRKSFEEPYGSGSGFGSRQAGYDYGYRNATSEHYRGKSWDQVESDIRSDYERSNPGSAWQDVKDSIRSGWEKATGKR